VRHRIADIVIGVDGQAELLEIVAAMSFASGFAGCLDGGQEDADEDSNDRNDDQQFDQCETAARANHTEPGF
jgi:hypothetical protein